MLRARTSVDGNGEVEGSQPRIVAKCETEKESIMKKNSTSQDKSAKLTIAKQTVRKLGQNETATQAGGGQLWTILMQCCGNSDSCW